MEKQKKKLSKKAVVICSVVLVVLVVGEVLIYKLATREKLYTFDEITNGLSEQVSYVVDAEGVLAQEEIDEIYDRYQRVNYARINENDIDEWYGIGDVTRHLVFYDTSNELLFEIFETRYSFVTMDINGVFNDYNMINI